MQIDSGVQAGLEPGLRMLEMLMDPQWLSLSSVLPACHKAGFIVVTRPLPKSLTDLGFFVHSLGEKSFPLE